MTLRRRGVGSRDQGVSAFSGHLMRLCDGLAAVAAALVDRDGETVDYAGTLTPFEARVMAAEWRLVLDATRQESGGTGGSPPLELALRGSARSFLAIALDAGYALVIQLPRWSLAVSQRALGEGVRTISEEAGLRVPPQFRGPDREWVRVDVQVRPNANRPFAVWAAGHWRELEVIGRFRESGLRRAVFGYRARLDDGVELTVVREPFNRWYSDITIK